MSAFADRQIERTLPAGSSSVFLARWRRNRVALMDEPLTRLDMPEAIRFDRPHPATGRPVMVASHDLNQAGEQFPPCCCSTASGRLWRKSGVDHAELAWQPTVVTCTSCTPEGDMLLADTCCNEVQNY
jgi:hypothetical protein